MTIIGVIAALTVPTIISKIQDYAFKNAFIKNYNIIKQAAAQADRDDEPFWSNSNDIYNIFVSKYYVNNPNELKNYFKIAKGPIYRGGGGGTIAINQIYGSGFNMVTDVKNLQGMQNGNYYFVRDSSALAFQLEDSTIVSFLLSDRKANVIYIDVNGRAKPNQWGRDIFALQARYINSNWIVRPYGAYGMDPGEHCRNSGLGFSCGYEILKNKSFNPPYK